MVILCNYCEENVGKYYCGRCFHVKYCSNVCQRKNCAGHKFSCYPLDKALFRNKNNVVLHEALAMNLFSEYQALHNREKATMSIFDQGRYYVLKGVVGMILFDPVRADMKPNMSESEQQWNSFKTDIRKGGELINQESPQSLRDPLIWLFIPHRCHRDIDFIWDGIGNWRC